MYPRSTGSSRNSWRAGDTREAWVQGTRRKKKDPKESKARTTLLWLGSKFSSETLPTMHSIYLYTDIYQGLKICTNSCMHACMHTYIHTYIHTFHTYVHTYIFSIYQTSDYPFSRALIGYPSSGYPALSTGLQNTMDARAGNLLSSQVLTR